MKEYFDYLKSKVLALEHKNSEMHKIIDEQSRRIENFLLIEKMNQEAIHQLSRTVENYRIIKDHLNLSSKLNVDFDARIAVENTIKDQYVYIQKLEKKIDEQENKLNRITGSKIWPYLIYLKRLIDRLRRFNK